MPIGRVIDCIVFAIWVSICAAEPEFIWQGFVILASHLSLSEVYSAILIALLLAFFVEPLTERIRTGRWELKPDNKASLHRTMVALVFGIGWALGLAVAPNPGQALVAASRGDPTS
jgi:hypothetical protein